MKSTVEEIIEVLTQINSNQVFQYRLAISMGTLSKRQPPPDAEEKTGEMETLYFHPSSNKASLFWFEDKRQSQYRHITNNSDLESVIHFLRDTEWTSRRVDTSWYLMGNVNANINIVRMYGADGDLISHLPCIPCFLRRHSMQHFHRDEWTKKVIKDILCFFQCPSLYLFNDTSYC